MEQALAFMEADVPLPSFSTTVTTILGERVVGQAVTKQRDDVQFVAVPEDGAYSPLERVSALLAQIAQQRVRSSPSFLQCRLRVALDDLDAAPVSLEHGSRSGNREPVVEMGFGRLSPAGLAVGVIESGRKIRLLRDNYVDAFAKGVGVRALLVDRRGDQGGIGFSVAFGYWVKLTIAPRLFGIVVAFCFISRRFVVYRSAECAPGTDPGRWLVV